MSKMVFRSGYGLAMLLVVAAIVLMARMPQVAAGAQPLVRLDPVSLGLKAGEQGTISIQVEDVQNLYGLEFHLSFDPKVVEVVDSDPAKPGTQIKSGDWLKNSFVAVNQADNATGKIDYGVTLLNPALPVNGNGLIATITLRAKSNGTSPLRIDKVILASRDGKEIKSSWQDGAIGVSALGQAPNVKPETRNSEMTDEALDTSQEASPIRLLVLVGIASVGGLMFLGVLVLVAVLVLRRR